MRFLDLNTGHTFDALWMDGQTNGYTFWFPNEQSVNLTYVMPICMICDRSTPITVSVEENDVFKFISSSTETTKDGFTFGVPTYSYSMETELEAISDNLYVHKVYVSGSSPSNGEYTTFIDIDGYGSIRIGADFYGENESLYINLSNNGVEIPESVQKAIYESNVHEDYKDNILINRKFKELMSNYWDVVANRGSYKSLINSLNWFEWGDILAIREMWKRNESGREVYDDREMCSLMEDKYTDSINGFRKTTYISLYASLKNVLNGQYDDEFNPILEDISLRWSKEDLSLKLSLLAEFFGAFFMPIHLSMFHACVEDKIYTNTIKTINGCTYERVDSFGNFDTVECNIRNGQMFRIENVRAQVTEDTVFPVTNDMDTTHTHFGVDQFTTPGMVDEDSLPTFAAQYYTGPGVIIPMEFTINNTSAKDFLKYVSVAFKPDGQDEIDNVIWNGAIHSMGGKITFGFNVLSKIARDYDMVFTFVLGSSKSLTKRVTFSTVDVDNLNLSLYKILSKDDKNGFTFEDFSSRGISDYVWKIQNTPPMTYRQYIPYVQNPGADYKGVKLNRTVVIDVRDVQYEIPRLRTKLSNYLIFQKTDGDTIKYLLCISKRFFAPIPDGIIGKYKVIRNDLGFYPQFHTIERIGGMSIEDYTITQYDSLCVIPEIHKSYDRYEPFRYGHMIEQAEWEFINTSTNEVISHPSSSRQPIVANFNDKLMSDGFYDIVFRYRLGGQKELRLDSAFRKKTV